jgi:hypothetical protein
MVSTVATLMVEQALAQGLVVVVTALQGTAWLTHPTVPISVDLRFKDGLVIRDVVDTASFDVLSYGWRPRGAAVGSAMVMPRHEIFRNA